MVMLATYWKWKPHCKSRKTPNVPVCFQAHSNCIQIPQIQINKNQLCRASSNICTHKAAGYPITTVNCSHLHSHTDTHTHRINYALENIFGIHTHKRLSCHFALVPHVKRANKNVHEKKLCKL